MNLETNTVCDPSDLRFSGTVVRSAGLTRVGIGVAAPGNQARRTQSTPGMVSRTWARSWARRRVRGGPRARCLHLGRRAPLPRRHRRSLVRQCRSRPPRDRRCGRRSNWQRMAHYSTSVTLRAGTRDLAERLAELAPVPGSRILFTSGGSDSVDTAAKLARRYWNVQRPAGEDDRVAAGTPITGCMSRERHWAVFRSTRRIRRLMPDARTAWNWDDALLAADRRGGCGPDRGFLLRADHRRRWDLPATRGISRARSAICPGVRHPVRRRRGGDRIRPDRRILVRLHPIRARAGYDDHCKGSDLRLCPDGRGIRGASGGRAVLDPCRWSGSGTATPMAGTPVRRRRP